MDIRVAKNLTVSNQIIKAVTIIMPTAVTFLENEKID
jgi:hypothetical protein